MTKRSSTLWGWRNVLVRAGTILVLLALVILPAPLHASAAGATYYVDGTSGSDSNPGSESQPWRTIQKAANSLNAGDTVIVAAGTYPERVGIWRSGVSGAQTVYQTGGTVVMRGFDVHANYVTVRGFEIADPRQDVTKWGIYVKGSRNIIENNKIHDMASGGILLFATTTNPWQTSYVTVRNNSIYRVGQMGIDLRGRYNRVLFNDISAIMQYVPWVTSTASWADADGIHFHGRGHILRGNTIHDISYSQPENRNPHIDCFQTFVSAPTQEKASNVRIDRNTCDEPERSDTLDVAAKFIQFEGAGNLKVTNNVVYTYLGGIVKNSRTVTIRLNTFAVPPAYDNGSGLQLINSSYVWIQDNIFSNQHNGIGAIFPDSTSRSTMVAGYNCLWRQGNRTVRPGDVSGQNPLFVDPSGDFHLQSGSPCIDRGMSVAVPADRDGSPRPQDAGYDMGAYEN